MLYHKAFQWTIFTAFGAISHVPSGLWAFSDTRQVQPRWQANVHRDATRIHRTVVVSRHVHDDVSWKDVRLPTGGVNQFLWRTETQHVGRYSIDFVGRLGARYRYYPANASASPPLWPFGHGLSYTTFDLLSCAAVGTTVSAFNFSCSVKNTGPVVGDEVVLVFHTAGDAQPVPYVLPSKSLVDFERLANVEPDETRVATFSIPRAFFSVTDDNGSRVSSLDDLQLLAEWLQAL